MSLNEMELQVQGLDCQNEAKAISRSFENFVGLKRIEIFPTEGRVKILYDTVLTSPEKIEEKFISIGFPPVEQEQKTSQADWYTNEKEKSPSNDNSSKISHPEKFELYVAHLDCENEANAIYRGFKNVPGVIEIKVFAKAAKVSFVIDTQKSSQREIGNKLQQLGFPPMEGRALPQAPKPWKNPKFLTSFISGVLFGFGFLCSSHLIFSKSFYIFAIAIGGYFFFREGIEKLLYKREIGIEILMSVAAIVSLLMGEAAEGAMLVFLYSMSEAAEGYVGEKTRATVKSLMNLSPKIALLRKGEEEIEVPVDELAINDVFIVKPGQAIATDGVVTKGFSNVNQASITGESIPIEKKIGDAVFATSLNGEGVLEVRATKTFVNNSIARIISMVQEAQEQKSKSQRFIERFGARYSPAILFIGFLIAIISPLLFGGEWSEWLTRATVFIVAAAPCALAISTPITLVAAIGTAARKGVLIKGGIYLEDLVKVKVIALDKTGTITQGQPEVTDVLVCDARQLSEHEILALASAIESKSEHPLARAVVEYARKKSIQPAKAEDFRSLIGAGASAVIEGSTIYIGSPSFFTSQRKLNLEKLEKDIRQLQDKGKTVVVLGSEQVIFGLIAIRDNVRPNAASAIKKLYDAGINKIVMLTGDNERTAKQIAYEVGLKDFLSELKPEDKAENIKKLANQFGPVMMVGDGVNDAPALAAASIGMAIGSAGNDVALETANIALMSNDFEKIVYSIELSKRTTKVIYQNLILSIGVISCLTIGAILGIFSLPVAVVGHEFSEFIVIANSLRMLRS